MTVIIVGVKGFKMHSKWINLGVNWWRNSAVMIACLHQDAEIRPAEDRPDRPLG